MSPTRTSPPNLSPSARRLLAVLARMTDAERAAATNRELAGRIGTSTGHPRTVSSALAALQQAGLVKVTRTKPDPRLHPTGRQLTLTATAREVVR